MSRRQIFQDFVNGRLAAAALDILGQYEKTLAEYQEICRSKEQRTSRMLLDLTAIHPEIKRHITDAKRLSLPESPPIKEEQDLWTSPAEEQLLFPEPLQIKEEQGPWTRQGEQLQWPQSDTASYNSIPRVKIHKHPEVWSQLPPLDQSPTVENRATGITEEQVNAECDDKYGVPALANDTRPYVRVLIKAESDDGDLGASEPARDSQPLFVSPHFPTAQSSKEERRGLLDEVKADCIEPKRSSTFIPSPWAGPISGPSSENESEDVSFGVKAAEKPYQCEACDKAFSDRAGLVRHRRSHTGEKPFQCEECGKAYSDQSGLARHKRVHTGVKPYTCEACGKAFRQRSSFVEHIKIHTGIRPYQCDECDKAFRQKSNLLKHKRIHTGEKPYQCEECGRAFTLKINLINHRRLHTGERPYQCDLCEKAFHEPSSLVAHRRSHTGERPYQCEICDKAFSQKGNLVKHRRVHTGEKPYQCEECDRAFSDRGNLICHKRIHAGNPWRRRTSVQDG